EEDALLMKGVETFGRRWSLIQAEGLRHRHQQSIAARWKRIMKRQMSEEPSTKEGGKRQKELEPKTKTRRRSSEKEKRKQWQLIAKFGSDFKRITMEYPGFPSKSMSANIWRLYRRLLSEGTLIENEEDTRIDISKKVAEYLLENRF